MGDLCKEPILTGETAGVRTWAKCGRALYGATGMCIHHAREAGLVARSFLSLEARAKMAAGRRNRKPKPDATEKKARSSETFAEIRRLRKAATERRRMREAAVDSRMNKPRGRRPSD